MYWIFKLLKRSGAANLFWGILMIMALWFLVSIVLDMELTGAIFDRIVSVGAIALIIIFQEEVRSLIYRVGARFSWRGFRKGRADAAGTEMAEKIVNACKHMSQTRTGALIVIAGHNNLKEIEDTGEYVFATVSTRLLENIFFKNTPLHDGAVIIANRQIESAACILPVSRNTALPAHFGLRHRAALGIAEKTDATAIVVSEETGRISVARDSVIREVSVEELFKETVRAAEL